jgi:hypothetical protein
MAKNDLNKTLDLNRYQDSGGLTTKKLNIGLWIVSHKRQFILATTGGLIALSAVFYGYSIYNYIDYLYFGGKAERLAIEQLATVSAVDEQQRIKNAAKKLEESGPQVFLNNNKYDFLAQVKNTNLNFFANFNYCFMDGATELACGSTFILPNETKYITVFATEQKYRPVNISVTIKDITWQRLDLHKYPDWKSFAANHLNFVVENAAFKTSDVSGLSEKIGLDILDFDITNNTAYNYWEVPVNIILSSGGTPVAINHYVLDEFSSGAKRSVHLSWPDSVPKPDQIAVIPNLNIADDTVFMKF